MNNALYYDQKLRKEAFLRRQRIFLRRRIALGFLLFLLMTSGILLALRGISGISEGARYLPDAHLPADSDAVPDRPAAAEADVLQLAAYLPKYPGLAPVIEQPANYPASLVELFLRNEETLDYLLGYPRREPVDVDIRREAESGGIPHFMQWDSRWGYKQYGSDMLGLIGCGPTSLSMVAVGLTGREDLDPAAIAAFSESAGHYVPGSGTAWSLLREGAANFGLVSEELSLNERALRSALSEGRPVICSMGPGDFTESGHYIVLTGLTEDGNITLNDPNSRARSERAWSYDEIAWQVKGLWAFSKA